jgi:hypothetical protein
MHRWMARSLGTLDVLGYVMKGDAQVVNVTGAR